MDTTSVHGDVPRTKAGTSSCLQVPCSKLKVQHAGGRSVTWTPVPNMGLCPNRCRHIQLSANAPQQAAEGAHVEGGSVSQ